VLDAALALEVDPANAEQVQLLRASVAMCVDASCGSRGNTGVHLREGDVVVVPGHGHYVRLRALKGHILVDALTGDEKTLVFPQNAVVGLVELISKWEELRQVLGVCCGGVHAGKARDSWYRLPGESATWRWDVGRMNEFMCEVLQALQLAAPDSFTWTWHSLRHMAASCQSAIGVSNAKIMWLQNWASMQVALGTYIDPLCPATAAAYRWYGWLLPPSRAEVDAAASAALQAPQPFFRL
jgi:hypothetical protein